MSAVQTLLALSFVLHISTSQGQKSFCLQFFSNIRTKAPLVVTANDSSRTGDVLFKFRPGHPETRIRFIEGDLEYLGFSPKNLTLKALQPLRSQLGRRLSLTGTCEDYISILAISVYLDVRIEVEIVDLNDPPVFLNLPAVVDLDETTSIKTTLFTVRAEDPFDVYKKNRIRHFSIKNVTCIDLDNTDSGIFSITDEGHFILEKPIDYEEGSRGFYVTITVEDEGEPPLSNVSVLVINVIDVDDEGPLFDHKTYSTEIIAEKPIQEPEECFDTTPPIFAADQDKDKKSEIEYRIVESIPARDVINWDTFFHLDDDSGQLCLRRMFEMPSHSLRRFEFRIQASQRDNSDKADFATLYVNVNNNNEYSPEFIKRLWRVSIPEYPDLKNGDLVVKLEAEDKDFGRNGRFAYHILSGEVDALDFNVETGELTVRDATVFDREVKNVYEMEVTCVETESLERKESSYPATVRISLSDANDNAPVFEKTSYSYTVRDSHPEGTPIQKDGSKVVAHDADIGVNGQIKYTITSVWNTRGTTSLSDIGRFLVSSEGQIILNRNFRLMRRMKRFPEYALEVQATDKAADKTKRRAAKTRVTINVVETNDHPPVFINQKLGHLLSHNQALELGLQSQGSRTEFTSHVAENSSPGGLVLKMPVQDADGDEDIFLNYRITSGNDGDVFDISNRGWLTHVKPLDRENHTRFDLVVQVSDGKHTADAMVHVMIVDSNDNAPIFNQSLYVFTIPEESGVGTVVGQVYATDGDEGVNGQVSYRLLNNEDDSDELFVIDEKTGVIYVQRLSWLFDRERNTFFSLTVEATDTGEKPKTATTEVKVKLKNINDNPPVFKHLRYHGTVVEDNEDPIQDQVVKMEEKIEVMDKDGSSDDVRFSLSGLLSEMFNIDPITAQITVANAGVIDCEVRCEYVFKIVATDNKGQGFATLADLTITVSDMNDNSPLFSEAYVFDLQNDLPVGNMVGKVKARDADMEEKNNQVMYILKQGGYGKFGVDFETGAIMLQDKLAREPLENEYTLQIQAFDTGYPRRSGLTDVTVRVPVNHPPVFRGNFSFTVAENQMPGTVVGTVDAFDKDHDELEYYLNSDIASSAPFSINRVTGQITTKGMFDRETVGKMVFHVHASDNRSPSHTAVAEVTVFVLDVNDHRPIFTESTYKGRVTEDDREPHVGQPVILVSPIEAKDNDENYENRNIVYSLSGEHSDYFIINGKSARLHVSPTGTGRIDRETTAQFKLKVIAQDQGGTGLKTFVDLIIEVEDVNDNTPSFKEYPPFEVPSTVQIGESVGFVIADDADATQPNNEIIYILEGDTYGKFSVDMAAGTISVVRALHEEPRHNLYQLHIRAVDKGSPTRMADTTIDIKTDTSSYNEHSPQITGDTVFFLKEEEPIGTLVGQMDVHDLDVGDTKVTFSKDDDSLFVPFQVTEDGRILVDGRIDRDRGDKIFQFTVNAMDLGTPPKNDSTVVVVVIQDINDNAPQFTQPQYRHKVHPLFPVGSIVATPFAFDPLDETPSSYYYDLMSLETGDPPEFLYIDHDTGVVRVNSNVLKAKKGSEVFSVKVRDVNNISLDSEATLKIDVIDEGQLKPCCCKIPCDEPGADNNGGSI